MKKSINYLILIVSLFFVISVTFVSCDLGGTTPTPDPDYYGEWVNDSTGFFTVEITASLFTKVTWDNDTRASMFSGTRGTYTETGGVITWTETEAYSSSLDWYAHNGAGTEHVVTWSVTGDVLSLTEDGTTATYTKLP